MTKKYNQLIMKKLYDSKVRLKFPYPELLLNFIAIFILACGHESVLLSTGIIIFLCIHSIMLWVRAGTSKAYLELKRHRHISEQRLKLIREIIGLSVYYDGYPQELIDKKFSEAVAINKLMQTSVIDIDKDLRKLSKTEHGKKLTREEAEFYCLMHSEFSMRELSVIYNLKHQKSIYVKRKRIIDKIGSDKINKTSPAPDKTPGIFSRSANA